MSVTGNPKTIEATGSIVALVIIGVFLILGILQVIGA